MLKAHVDYDERTTGIGQQTLHFFDNVYSGFTLLHVLPAVPNIDVCFKLLQKLYKVVGIL